MAAIATMLTQTYKGEESNIMIIAGSLEELNAYLGTQGHTGTPDASYIKFQVGPKVEEARPIDVPGILLARQFAGKIGTREIGEELTKEEEKEAEDKGLVVVFGSSDDLAEFRGAIRDESGAYGGGVITFSKKGVIFTPEKIEALNSLVEDGTISEPPAVNEITTIWDESGIPWTYSTTIPHATFDITEDEAVFCRAIVFHTKDLK